MSTMRVGRPKGENTKNANHRRKQLIDAAVACIVERGVSLTTLAAVAEASGLSQGTALFYFKTKESLITAAFKSRLEEYIQNWTVAVQNSAPDPVDKIVALVFAFLDLRLLTPENLALWNSFWTEAIRNPSFRVMSQEHDAERQKMMLALCRDAKTQFANTVWTPEAAAHSLEMITEGAWNKLYYSPSYISPKQARLAAGTLLASIFPLRSGAIMNLAAGEKKNAED